MPPPISLILDHRDMTVSMDGRTIRIDRPGSRLQRVPLTMLAEVVVIGSPMVSCDVWRNLAEQGTPVHLLPARGSGEATFIGAGLSASVALRLAQYRSWLKEEKALGVARWFLEKKLRGQQENLVFLGKRNQRQTKPLLDRIENTRHKVSLCHERSGLMGHEGAAAIAYFQGLAQIIAPRWGFGGRNRRPPRDPVNALLSLCYTLASSTILRTLQRKGFDPALGFLHPPEAGRHSLVLDALEPVRPQIDRFVLQLLESPLTLRDFTTNDQDGCRLNKAGREKFYRLWFASQNANDKESLPSTIVKVIEELAAMISSPSAPH